MKLQRRSSDPIHVQKEGGPLDRTLKWSTRVSRALSCPTLDSARIGLGNYASAGRWMASETA